MTPGDNPGPARARLETLRRPLLRLHKALLGAEREEYEKQHGPIQGGGQLLQLVIGDPWFAWLRPMSGLIVLIDEHLEAKDERPSDEGPGLVDQVRALTTPEDRYTRLLKDHPEAAAAQRELEQALTTH